jgi:hypothetical protein
MKTNRELAGELKRKAKRLKRRAKRALKVKKPQAVQKWLKNSNFVVKLPNI